jgi:hypothetical protein
MQPHILFVTCVSCVTINSEIQARGGDVDGVWHTWGPLSIRKLGGWLSAGERAVFLWRCSWVGLQAR